MKRNYIPGTYETVVQQAAGTIAVGQSQYFVLDEYYKFIMSDISVFSGIGKTLVTSGQYSLVVDEKYTETESGYSAKTLYCQIQFSDSGLNGEPFFVSGRNYGTYTDNEATVDMIDTEVPVKIDDWWAIVGDAYYTSDEVDLLIAGKSDTNHTHSLYESKGLANAVNVADGNGGWKATNLKNGTDTPNFSDIQKLDGTLLSALEYSVDAGNHYMGLRTANGGTSTENYFNAYIDKSVTVKPIEHPEGIADNQSVNRGQVIAKTGFDNPDIDLTYNEVARTVTLANKGGNTVKAYYNGVTVSALVNGWTSPAHPSPTGDKVYYLYYDGSSTAWRETPWSFGDLMIALVHADDITFCVKETHGTQDKYSHENDHTNIGTYVKKRGGFSGYTLNSTTLSNKQISVGEYILHDEDNPTTLPALTGGNGAYTHMYLQDVDHVQGLVDQNQIVAVDGATGRPLYQQIVGGVYTNLVMNNGDYAKVTVMAVPVAKGTANQKYRFLWIRPQYAGTETNVRAKQTTDIDLGCIGGGSLPEYNFIGEVIIRATNNNYELIDVMDVFGTRFQQISANVGATPNLDQVTSAGGVSTNTIVIDATDIVADPDAFRVEVGGVVKFAVNNQGNALGYYGGFENLDTLNGLSIKHRFGSAAPTNYDSTTIFRKPPSGTGIQFVTSTGSIELDGAYVQNGTGGDFGDPVYERTYGGVTYKLFSGTYNGVIDRAYCYWFLGTTVLTGNEAFNAVLYRSNVVRTSVVGGWVYVTGTPFGGATGSSTSLGSTEFSAINVDYLQVTEKSQHDYATASRTAVFDANKSLISGVFTEKSYSTARSCLEGVGNASVLQGKTDAWMSANIDYSQALGVKIASGVCSEFDVVNSASKPFAWYFSNNANGAGGVKALIETAYMGPTGIFYSNATAAQIEAGGSKALANLETINARGASWVTGYGGTVTQTTSRTTGVTLNKQSGAITLVSAAGSTAWQSFTVTNSTVAATDTVIVNQKSGTDKYMVHVTTVSAGSFVVTYATTGGTTTEQPVFNFALVKGVTA